MKVVTGKIVKDGVVWTEVKPLVHARIWNTVTRDVRWNVADRILYQVTQVVDIDVRNYCGDKIEFGT